MSSEVVIAVPGTDNPCFANPVTTVCITFIISINLLALQLQNCKAKFASDIAVSSQDVCIKDGVGAYTGKS